MKKKSEKIWLTAITVFTLIVVGLLTKFRFSESLDISLHDTYFVMSNIQVTIITALLILIVYGLSYGGLLISRINNIMKYSSIILQIAIGIILVGFSVLLMSSYLESGLFPTDSINMGFLTLFTGLGLILLIRTVEIIRMKK